MAIYEARYFVLFVMLRSPKPWHFMPQSLYLWKQKKNHVNKNQGWDGSHQKYEANENTSRHSPRVNKSKQSTKIM